MEKLLKKTRRSSIYVINEAGKKKIKRVMEQGSPEVYRLLKNTPHRFLPEIYSVAVHADETEVTEEFIEGTPVSGICFSEKEMLAAAKEICIAAAHLHSLGIVHRDIKPSNILMAQDGHIRLIDFDAARIIKPAADSDTVCLGTKGFAPPEQYGFSQTDVRSDIYALGKTLGCIFGSLSYKRKYRRVIDKCTRLDPEKRYSSADEVLAALGRCSINIPLTVSLTVTALAAAACITLPGDNSALQSDVTLPAEDVQLTESSSPVTEISQEESSYQTTAALSSYNMSVSTAASETVTQSDMRSTAGAAISSETEAAITETQPPEASVSDIITSTSAISTAGSVSDADEPPPDPFEQYSSFLKNLDTRKAGRISPEEMEQPILFRADDGIPFEYIIIDTASLKENKYAAMLLDCNNDGYEDIFQISAYNPEGQDEYFRSLCVSVVMMYDTYPDFHVISDNPDFIPLLSTAVIDKETGMTQDRQYVQLSVTDVDGDGYNDMVLSVGRPGNFINTHIFYSENIYFDYSSSGQLNAYIHSTQTILCGRDGQLYTLQDGRKDENGIISLSREDALEFFGYTDPYIFDYEKEDDPLYQFHEGIARRR